MIFSHDLFKTYVVFEWVEVIECKDWKNMHVLLMVINDMFMLNVETSLAWHLHLLKKILVFLTFLLIESE